jgi:hypothetical protein
LDNVQGVVKIKLNVHYFHKNYLIKVNNTWR